MRVRIEPSLDHAYSVGLAGDVRHRPQSVIVIDGLNQHLAQIFPPGSPKLVVHKIAVQRICAAGSADIKRDVKIVIAPGGVNFDRRLGLLQPACAARKADPAS